MRILIRCDQCQRRYDVSRFKVGVRVRCHCGHVMRIRKPRGHDASVVRCSSCGAPREKGSAECTFCHSDFTLFERDLHTVCPQCLARISDRARFCHHCGERVGGEVLGGEKKDWPCPACGAPATLLSRRLGKEKINVGECQRCAGLWIGHECFDVLRERAIKDAASLEGLLDAPPKAAAGREQPPAKGYRPCPRCGELMHRRHYGRSSGVIIDLCRVHGIWFDDHELHQLLDWIGRGGHATAQPPPGLERPPRAQQSDEPADPLSAAVAEMVEMFFER